MAELANSSVVEYVFKHKQNHMFEHLYEGELRISTLQHPPLNKPMEKSINDYKRTKTPSITD